MLRLALWSSCLLAAAVWVSAVHAEETFSPQWKSVDDRSTAESQGSPATAVPMNNQPAIVFPDSSPKRSDESTSGEVRLASVNFPADQGQVWREYDISPYAMRVPSTQRPEQAIIDWILRETGYEAWHNDTISCLSATSRKLRVYHTPEIQKVVGGIVDRFVSAQADGYAFGMRVITVNHPNWRAKSQGLLHPVTVQTPGVQAWILRKEDAAVWLSELRRRSDFREHSSPYLMVHNGQPAAVNLLHPMTYVRDIVQRPDVWPGFQPESGQIDEGLSFEFCPLLSLDAQTLDATIKCNVTRVEKTVPVVLDIATPAAANVGAANQRAKIDVPEIAQFRFHERFRWPTDQVLVISMGLVAEPTKTTTTTLVNSLPLGLGGGSDRADLLMMIESKPQENPVAPVNDPNTLREAKTYRGRY